MRGSINKSLRRKRVLNRKGRDLIVGIVGATLLILSSPAKDFMTDVNAIGNEWINIQLNSAVEINEVKDMEKTVANDNSSDVVQLVDKVKEWNSTRQTDIIIRVGEYNGKAGKRVYLLESQLDSIPKDIPIHKDEKGQFVHEFDINKKIATRLYNELINKGVSAQLQIANNKSEDLNAAGRLSNKSNPRLYLSIHTNAFDKETANGYFFISNPGDETAANIAGYLSESIKDNGLVEQKSNRTNTDNYIGELNVIHNSTICILGELGYYTNPAEIINICSDKYANYLAEHLSDELIEILDKFWA